MNWHFRILLAGLALAPVVVAQEVHTSRPEARLLPLPPRKSGQWARGLSSDTKSASPAIKFGSPKFVPQNRTNK